eukprot:SAG11_NODE_34514_length_271_cov_1.186047_1_plen_42_part_01
MPNLNHQMSSIFVIARMSITVIVLGPTLVSAIPVRARNNAES